jgi:hypothetical protein
MAATPRSKGHYTVHYDGEMTGVQPWASGDDGPYSFNEAKRLARNYLKDRIRGLKMTDELIRRQQREPNDD